MFMTGSQEVVGSNPIFSTAEQWAANTRFLDRMILRGDNIRLATPLSKVKPGSFYQKELNYLFDKGYKVSSDGLWLVK